MFKHDLFAKPVTHPSARSPRGTVFRTVRWSQCVRAGEKPKVTVKPKTKPKPKAKTIQSQDNPKTRQSRDNPRTKAKGPEAVRAFGDGAGGFGKSEAGI